MDNDRNTTITSYPFDESMTSLSYLCVKKESARKKAVNAFADLLITLTRALHNDTMALA